MHVKGTGSWCMLVEYVKDNNYARFHDPSYHRYRESHFSVLLAKKSVGQEYRVMVRNCRVYQ